jgi:hypothetical protein
MNNERHVVPNPDGGWDVKAPHASRASSHHDTQTDAEARAKEILGNLPGGGDAVVHGADGKIRAREKVIPSPRAEHGEGAPWAALAQEWGRRAVRVAEALDWSRWLDPGSTGPGAAAPTIFVVTTGDGESHPVEAARARVTDRGFLVFHDRRRHLVASFAADHWIRVSAQ